MCISHSPHVFIHRVVHPNILFIHRHRRDNFQGLRLVSHRLHCSHMHKNAHRKLYLKEKAKKKKKRREWTERNEGIKLLVSILFLSSSILFFYIFCFKLSLWFVCRPIAVFVLFSSFFVLAIAWLLVHRCCCCCCYFCYMSYILILLPSIFLLNAIILLTCPEQSIRWAKIVVIFFIILQVKPKITTKNMN